MISRFRRPSLPVLAGAAPPHRRCFGTVKPTVASTPTAIPKARNRVRVRTRTGIGTGMYHNVASPDARLDGVLQRRRQLQQRQRQWGTKPLFPVQSESRDSRHRVRTFSTATSGAEMTTAAETTAANNTDNTNNNGTTPPQTTTTKPTPTPSGPVTLALRREIDSGSIRGDERQWEAATELDRLCADLAARERETETLSGSLISLAERRTRSCGRNAASAGSSSPSSHRHRFVALSRRHPKHRGRGDTHGRGLGEGWAVASALVRSALRKISRRLLRLVRTPVRGVYLHGSVGVGKSFLMDLFHETVSERGVAFDSEFDSESADSSPSTRSLSSANKSSIHSSSPPLLVRSRRVHFHEFLLDVHQRIHALSSYNNTNTSNERDRRLAGTDDPLRRVAEDLSKTARILCLDEFQVTDIADAMILKGLFEALLENGVVVVATSNRPPSKLYEGGLNRASFLPFVDTLLEHCRIVALEGDRDYRKLRPASGRNADGGTNDVDDNNKNNDDDDRSPPVSWASSSTYFWPIDHPATRSALASIAGEKRDTTTEVLKVPMGRTLAARTVSAFASPSRSSSSLPSSDSCCGRFSFDELCGEPLGAADYLVLAERYRFLVVEGVPLLDGSRYNEARRFVTLIDACYEARVRLVVTAAVPLPELFVEFEADAEPSDDGDEDTTAATATTTGTGTAKTKTKPTTAKAMTAGETELRVVGEGGSSSSHSTTTIRARDSGEAVEWSATGRIGVSLAQLSSVREVVFSFRRAESRLHELCRAKPTTSARR